MGLDIIEFVMAVEGTFGIDIPDADASRLETPRMLIDYLTVRLNVAPESGQPCLSQRAFYRSRAALAQRLGVDRRSLRRDSHLRAVLGKRSGEWKEIGRDLGSRTWPPLKSESSWFAGAGGVTTLGELAENLAVYDAGILRDPNAPWTKTEIEVIVRALIARELAVDMSQYTLDSYFVRDMGCG